MTALALGMLNACDYLDVTPDDVTTIDHAFVDRNEAEKFLFTCYSYRPHIGDINYDPAMSGADEIWQYYPSAGYNGANPMYVGQQIARGFQNSNSPYLDSWHGGDNNATPNLWCGIRDCNIMLEKIETVPNIPDWEKKRWIAEVKFLKAYYHYYLLRCYGPIPITDVSLPISAGVDEVRVYRDPVDEVAKYISDLMYEAAQDLPNPVEIQINSEGGRIDKMGALSIRAEVLLTMASDLFNGNADYAREPLDKRTGKPLFNQTKDLNKWKLAADACREVIDMADAQDKRLFDEVHSRIIGAPEELQLQTVYRQAVCERWNRELLWGGTNYDSYKLASDASARIIAATSSNQNSVNSQWAPTLKLAEAYYSSNGVPIDEDKDWDANKWYENRYKLREEPSSGVPEIYYVKEGQQTAYLHYNREPRFYASLGFDRGIYYGSGYYRFPEDVKWVAGLLGEANGRMFTWHSVTGYSAKKMHSFSNAIDAAGRLNNPEYFPFPIMRLANVYLMYAEALNEAENSQTARALAIEYLDKVRARAGLKGVVDAWKDHSRNSGKPASQDGLRAIIRQERTIELALEGKRFWDLRRWKKISELNVQPKGWNIAAETAADYYNVVDVAPVPVNFTTKDYFWPIAEKAIISNSNLVQNFGW
jgi:hypothetical protein